jgi:hypothetical protein
MYRQITFKGFDMKNIFKSEISNQLVDDFALWAFGEGYENKKSQDLMEAWNLLHANEVALYGSDRMDSSAKKMVDHWIKSQLKP